MKIILTCPDLILQLLRVFPAPLMSGSALIRIWSDCTHQCKPTSSLFHMMIHWDLVGPGESNSHIELATCIYPSNWELHKPYMVRNWIYFHQNIPTFHVDVKWCQTIIDHTCSTCNILFFEIDMFDWINLILLHVTDLDHTKYTKITFYSNIYKRLL